MRQVSIIVVVALGLFIAWAQQVQADSESNIQKQLSQNSLWSRDRGFDPNLGKDSWRFVPYIGWRKFAPNDVFYKDWRDIRRWSRFRPFPYWPY